MLKKDIKAYVKERKIEKTKAVNALLEKQNEIQMELQKAEEEYRVYTPEISLEELSKQILEARLVMYTWELFEVVVSETKYQYKGIKLMKHDFKDVTEEVLDQIPIQAKAEILDKIDEDDDADSDELKERMIYKLLWLYHTYTGYEDGKRGKF